MTGPSDVPRISPRLRGSQVGFAIDHVRNRQIRFESLLEAQHISRLSVDPKTRMLREQVARGYVDEDGQTRTYTADFVRERDGVTDVFEAKYEIDIVPSGVEDKLCRCATAADQAGLPMRMAIVDEHSEDAIAVGNADLVRRFAGDRDHAAVDAAREWLATEAPARFPLRAVRLAGHGFRGMRAVASLLTTGEVALAEHAKIDADTILVNCLFNRE